MGCRNSSRANLAVDDIVSETNCERSRLVVLPTELNLSSLQSVRNFVIDLQSREVLYPHLCVLVNNAGISGTYPIRYGADGFEEIFSTNHLGHFLLTVLLLPILRQAQSATIINVASEVHNPETKTGVPDPGESFPFDDLMSLAKGIPNNGDSDMAAGLRRYFRLFHSHRIIG